jgi:hypothetical protein
MSLNGRIVGDPEITPLWSYFLVCDDSGIAAVFRRTLVSTLA